MGITQMIAAIHQPNFFPWLGYFNKIASSDIFVFLDSALFSKGSRINRVKLIMDNQPRWATCPIVRRGSKLIKDIKIDDTQPWRKKLLKTVKINYSKTPFFDDVMRWITPMISRPINNLSQYNIKNIKSLAQLLDIKCRFILNSELKTQGVFDKTGSERLAFICRELGADTYLSGDGAEEYEEPLIYQGMGITLTKNNFCDRRYKQHGLDEFISGLSVLDVLFNIGPEGTAGILQK